MGGNNFKKLKIWEEGITIVSETYKMVKDFADFEKFNLLENKIQKYKK